MTLLRPGERPPQVTIPTPVVSGLKKIFFLGPIGGGGGVVMVVVVVVV